MSRISDSDFALLSRVKALYAKAEGANELVSQHFTEVYGLSATRSIAQDGEIVDTAAPDMAEPDTD